MFTRIHDVCVWFTTMKTKNVFTTPLCSNNNMRSRTCICVQHLWPVFQAACRGSIRSDALPSFRFSSSRRNRKVLFSKNRSWTLEYCPIWCPCGPSRNYGCTGSRKPTILKQRNNNRNYTTIKRRNTQEIWVNTI